MWKIHIDITDFRPILGYERGDRNRRSEHKRAGFETPARVDRIRESGTSVDAGLHSREHRLRSRRLHSGTSGRGGQNRQSGIPIR